MVAGVSFASQGEGSMVEQRIFGALVIAAVMSVGSACDDAKTAAEVDASVPKVSAEPVVETPPAESAAPAPVATVNPMILIPAGSFTMGSTDGQRDEKPTRQVRVAAFEMDVMEVTLGAYVACTDADKCTYPDEDSFCNWGKKGHNIHPMNCLDWDQATAYCASVGKRLPTEEEWEYAARGTDGRAYPWGTGAPPAGVCYNRPKKGTCPAESVPVDSPFGLRGMAGNVWEWTSSGYNEDYGKKRLTDRRVYRGASFYEEDAEDLRATLRNMRPPNTRFDYLGFRCARTPKGAK
jgi:formylglycine-generating enzyme required for sulfatase activity